MIPLDTKLETVNLTSNLFKSTINVASEKYLNGFLTETSLKAYLSSYSINNYGQEKLMNHCNNINALEYVMLKRIDNIRFQSK